jgi:multidrug efflux pump subunit AcrA (membrane-fusion protein)
MGVVRGPVAARLGVGMSAPVTLSGAPGGAGVLVPRSALIRTAGQTFAYVRKDATHFERRALVAPTSQPEGLFSAGGLAPGESVVVSGASALLAAETAPKAGD